MIIEGNKLIAEFMGYETHENWEFWITDSYIEKFDWYSPGTMKFHNDWNWIMSVIEKISSLGYIVTIESEPRTYLHSCLIQCANSGDRIHEDHINNTEFNSLLEIVWFECITFLMWYEENK